METIRNVNQLLVAKNISKTATANLVITDYSVIADGEVCVVDPRTNKQVTSAGYTDGFPSFSGFKLVQRSGTKLIHSDIIMPGSVRKYSISLPATFPATEQIDYVGYNGSTGSLDVINSNIYTLRLYILESTINGFMQQKVKEGFYKSTSSATQQAVARGLVQSLIKNYSREPVQDIVFERINAGAQANALATSTVSVVNGSNAIKCSEDMTALITAGTILRFGTSGAGTAPCYVVTGHDGGATTARVYYLDIPWQGATNSAFAAASFESVTEGNWGIKIAGVAQTYDGRFFGAPTTWTTAVDFSDTQTTTVTKAQAASVGTGNYDVLARLEKELQADEYVYRVFNEGAPVDRTDVLSGTTYDVVTIEYDGVTENKLGDQVKSPKVLTIVQAGNGAQADVAAIGWLTLLNHIIVTTWAVPGAAALTPTA